MRLTKLSELSSWNVRRLDHTVKNTNIVFLFIFFFYFKCKRNEQRDCLSSGCKGVLAGNLQQFLNYLVVVIIIDPETENPRFFAKVAYVDMHDLVFYENTFS